MLARTELIASPATDAVAACFHSGDERGAVDEEIGEPNSLNPFSSILGFPVPAYFQLM